MQFLQAFFPITVLLCIIESREYHYNKPALPFLENVATNEVQSPATTVNYRQGVSTQVGGISLPTVIQTSGPSATNYELYGMQSSQQIFQGTAIPRPTTVSYQSPSPHVNYNPSTVNVNVQPHPWHQQMNSNAYAFPTHTQAYSSRVPITQNYRQQGSLQAPQQIVQQPGAQAGQSTLVNPFTSYNPNAPISNIDQRTTQYRASPAQLIAASQPGFNTQYGAPTRGDYVSQSESGQLDVYSYKHQSGDSRTYERIITTCYPNGQCERLQLNTGPTDPNHNNVISSTRSYTAPVPNKCQRIAEARRQAALSQGAQGSVIVPVVQPNSIPFVVGPIRPANRRLFPYSEIVLPRETYN